MALHSNRGAVQQCIFLDIPLVYLRLSYDFLWMSVFEVDPGSRSTKNRRDPEWACRTTKKKMLAYISFAPQSFSLSLPLSVSVCLARERWLRKFKLPSHKRGNKKFARKAVLRAATSAYERGVPVFLLLEDPLAQPLTEFDHLCARCDSQKK